jgi:hypothetical protein
MRFTYTGSALLLLLIIQIESNGKIRLDYSFCLCTLVLAAGIVIDITEIIIDRIKTRAEDRKNRSSTIHRFSSWCRSVHKHKPMEAK